MSGTVLNNRLVYHLLVLAFFLAYKYYNKPGYSHFMIFLKFEFILF